MISFDATLPGLAAAWLATYLLHSTLLLGGAWAVARLLGDRALGLQEGLWKTALVGGLLTASLHVGLAALPVTEALPEVAATSGATASGTKVPASSGTEATLPAASVSSTATSAAATLVSPAPVVGKPIVQAPTPHPWLDTVSARLHGWARLALAVWLVGAALLLTGLGASWWSLRRRLAGRRDVHGAPRRLLDRLLGSFAAAAPVRLSSTSRLPVPVALGPVRREICVPRRALGLDRRSQEAILAHELAHLERRDPAWLLLARLMECVLFLQPLNRLARIRLQELSEYLCDAWAVERTGDRVGLARSLTEVAAWLRPSASLPVPAMASRPGPLRGRVERILTGNGEARRRSSAWGLAAGAVALVTVATLVPGLPVASAADLEPEVELVAELEQLELEQLELEQLELEQLELEQLELEQIELDEIELEMQDLDAEIDLEALEMEEVLRLQERLELEELRLDDLDLEAIELAELDLSDLDLDIDLALETLEMDEIDWDRFASPGEPSPEELEELEARARELAERHRPSEAELEELEARARELAERSRPSEAELEELRARARELAERHRPSEAELEELRARARELAERHRPSEAELEELRARARELAERSRPSEEELERLRAEVREMVERHHPSPEELEELERRLEREVERQERRRERQEDLDGR